MTRLYLWTVCAVVVLVGSYRWYVKLYPPENLPIKFRYVTVTNYVTETKYVEQPDPWAKPIVNQTPIRDAARDGTIWITNILFGTNSEVFSNNYTVRFYTNLYVTNCYVTNLWSNR